MKMFTLRPAYMATIASGMLLLASCDKSQDPTAIESLTSAEDSGVAEDTNASASDLLNAAAPQDATQSGSTTVASAADLARLLSGCATRTYDAATKTLTLDFGLTNCIGPNGVARRGKLVAVFSGPYRQTGAVITVTPVEYFVNDKQHTGTRVLTNLGNGSYSVSVAQASVITSEGTHTWSAQRQYTRTAGFGTPTILDDKYSVTGSATGTNRQGITYSAKIEQPLLKEFAIGCARHFVAGTVSVTNSQQKTMLLNYDPTGTQSCDNIASVTINGRTRTIRLR
ncbi:hypothetical protein H8B13_13895 [Hymenobacter sp. BT188]|uniref:hypothetical protein n=1 Tax=Hymenobacter sp. BT188 TaxID=2763504 RepID=UPI0016518037|nr:hypothetical protein [Hymenobacter sp. BT188]MBC6607914.1 hypothetical protein [Hymenobacter sp. BT188]